MQKLITTFLVLTVTFVFATELTNKSVTNKPTSNPLYNEDFEASNGGYVPDPATDAWEWGVPITGPDSAHSGTRLWVTSLSGTYADSANWKLKSVKFIATANNPELRFWHWYDMEETYDGGNVKISLDNGVTWGLISPVGGYPGIVSNDNAGIPGESCYTGIETTWTEVVFNLPAVSGQQFFIRWHFGPDQMVAGYGWFIDDVSGMGFDPSGIAEQVENNLPIITALGAAPNPAFNSLVRISFSVSEPTKASLKIYDASGRLIRTLVNSKLERGVYNLTWNGTDDSNREVAEGIYFYTLQTDKYNSTKKLVFTR